MTWNKLSAFSLASFEMNAQMGGTHRFADAVTGMEDQISLSPQAMGMMGVAVTESWGNVSEESFEQEEHADVVEDDILEEDLL